MREEQHNILRVIHHIKYLIFEKVEKLLRKKLNELIELINMKISESLRSSSNKKDNYIPFTFSDLLVDVSELIIEETPISRDVFGSTFKAKSKTKNQSENIYAIKFFDRNLKTTIKQQSFLNNIKIQSYLKHEAIIPFIGYFVPTNKCNKYGVITKYMPNGTLSELIRKCGQGLMPANWETIKAINVFGIASGMAYMHQHDVIFRNLNPDSIILDENFHPKIANFECSKRFKQGTENQIDQTLSVGTPVYVAPEVIDDIHYSNKIDVYSYSMVLYQIFTLEVPWSDKRNLTYFSLFNLVQAKERPTFNNKYIPEIWMELIDNCWDHDPSKRPSFIQIVKKLLDNIEGYFDFHLIDEDEFRDYIDAVIEDLNFDGLE